MPETSKDRNLATNSGCTILLGGACIAVGFIMIIEGDVGSATTYHAGWMLLTNCFYLVIYFLLSLGFPPEGRWAGIKQPIAILGWIALGALAMCVIEYLSHSTCCTGSIYGDILDIISLTWLPSFWLVKLPIDRFLDKRHPSLK